MNTGEEFTKEEELQFVDEDGRNLELHRLAYHGDEREVEKLVKRGGFNINKGTTFLASVP
jgi:hypothetical protein